ncbi:cytochrome P450 [Exidia glandulosa HHB12029]|uniref:Cytochrome P450 n=1 Tax=Exidia glandulosa HHB12029 TaxID=1314781 RepID=A0A165J5H4_EXIGL|nr:cytochrome P450 [Exidia glandulosa HHB12029]
MTDRTVSLQLCGATLLGAYTATLVTKAVWNTFFSPLASFPGPRFAAISDLWSELHGLRFRRVMAIDEAHQKYGDVVRIGPNRLAFADGEAAREIYRSHNYLKSSWYDFFTFGGRENTFCTKDPLYHAKARRWSAPAFRGDNLRRSTEALREEMIDLVDRIKCDSAGGKPVDVLHLFRLLSLDILGITVFGTRFEQMKSGQNHPFTEYLDRWLVDKALSQYLPRAFNWLLRRLPIPQLQRIFAADPAMFALGEQMYDTAGNLAAGADIVTMCKAYRDPMTGEPAPRAQIVTEAAVFIGAGTDSTSIALTYLAYELALTERFSEEIHKELAQLSDAQSYDVDALKALPYLNAFIKEVLRVHGPAPGFFERVVPRGGAYLAGRFIPGGTIVGAQAWTFHRSQDLFPDPLSVSPERWVERSNGAWVNKTLPAEVHNAFFPFGQGVRACVGRPLAEMELLLVTATIVRNFRLTRHKSTTDVSMRPIDLAVVGPRP